MMFSDLSSDLFRQSVEIKIVRQPSSVYRFRYKTDTRQTNLFADEGSNLSAEDNHSTLDLSSTASNNMDITPPGTSASFFKSKKLPPKIQIVNAPNHAIIRVTCVTADSPHYIHPNYLHGFNCDEGIARIPIETGTSFIELKDIRIELVKRNEIRQRIEKLKQMRIDPYQTGYEADYVNMDLGRVRLCIELLNAQDETMIAMPQKSNVISTNKQKMSILIQRKTNLKSVVSGGDDVVLFVKKLEKDQKPIIAKFFDETGWFAPVEIKDIHYRCAMIFKAPAYKDQMITNEVNVLLKLIVPSDDPFDANTNLQEKYESEVVEFVYTPLDSASSYQKKRKHSEEKDSWFPEFDIEPSFFSQLNYD